MLVRICMNLVIEGAAALASLRDDGYWDVWNVVEKRRLSSTWRAFSDKGSWKTWSSTDCGLRQETNW